VDQLTLQRNLSILENRYRELREISESRLQSLEAEKAILKQELEQSDLISLQLRQAQEELDLTRQEIQQLKEQIQLRDDKLKEQIQLHDDKLKELTDLLDANFLATQQAQEELELCHAQYIKDRDDFAKSIKKQMMLLVNTLINRSRSWAARMFPYPMLRRGKRIVDKWNSRL
jgi:hypothetical protein